MSVIVAMTDSFRRLDAPADRVDTLDSRLEPARL